MAQVTATTMPARTESPSRPNAAGVPDLGTGRPAMPLLQVRCSWLIEDEDAPCVTRSAPPRQTLANPSSSTLQSSVPSQGRTRLESARASPPAFLRSSSSHRRPSDGRFSLWPQPSPASLCPPPS
jgi:hypothetical protein